MAPTQRSFRPQQSAQPVVSLSYEEGKGRESGTTAIKTNSSWKVLNTPPFILYARICRTEIKFLESCSLLFFFFCGIGVFSNSPAMSPSLLKTVSHDIRKGKTIVVLIPSPSQQVKLESFTSQSFNDMKKMNKKLKSKQRKVFQVFLIKTLTKTIVF